MAGSITTDSSGTASWVEALNYSNYWLHYELAGYSFSRNDYPVSVGDTTCNTNVWAYLSGRLASPTITTPAVNGTQVLPADLSLKWNESVGAASYVVSLRNLSTDELLLNHQVVPVENGQEYTLASDYLTDGASYRAAVGAVPAGVDSSSPYVGWSERLFDVTSNPDNDQFEVESSAIWVSSSSWMPNGLSSSRSVQLIAQSGWTVECDADWIAIYIEDAVDVEENTVQAQSSAPTRLQVKAMGTREAITNEFTYENAELVLLVSSNTTEEDRTATIYYSSNGETRSTVVTQSADDLMDTALNSLSIPSTNYTLGETVHLTFDVSAFSKCTFIVKNDNFEDGYQEYPISTEGKDFYYKPPYTGSYTIIMAIGNDEYTGMDENVEREATREVDFAVTEQAIDYGGITPSDQLIDYLISALRMYSTAISTDHGYVIGYEHYFTNADDFNGMMNAYTAKKLLLTDLAEVCRFVNQFAAKNGLTLYQNEFDALVSCCFQMGTKALSSRYRLASLLTTYKGHYSEGIVEGKLFNAFLQVHGGSSDTMRQANVFKRYNDAKMFLDGFYGHTQAAEDWSWFGNGNQLNADGAYIIPEDWVPVGYISEYEIAAEYDNVYYSRNAHHQLTINITFNDSAWTAVSDSSWLHINGKNNGKIIYSIEENTGSDNRVGHITLSLGNLEKIIAVEQAGTAPAALQVTAQMTKDEYYPDEIPTIIVNTAGGAGDNTYSWYVYNYESRIVDQGTLDPGFDVNPVSIPLNRVGRGGYSIMLKVTDRDGHSRLYGRSMNSTSPQLAFAVIYYDFIISEPTMSRACSESDPLYIRWTNLIQAEHYKYACRDLKANTVFEGETNNPYFMFEASQVANMSGHAVRFWVAAYSNNQVLGQAQTVTSIGPVDKLSIHFPEDTELDGKEYIIAPEDKATITWSRSGSIFAYLDVDHYEVRIKDDTAESMLVENANYSGNQIKFDGLYALTGGHSYHMWIGALSKEGVLLAVSTTTYFTTEKTAQEEWQDGLVHSLIIDGVVHLKNIGDQYAIKTKIEPSNATIQTLNWTSDHPEIAIVDNAGIVIAKSKGIAVITATTTDGTNLKSSCQVNVGKDSGTTSVSLVWDSEKMYSETNIGTNRLLTSANSNGTTYLRIPNNGSTTQKFTFNIASTTDIHFSISHMTPDGHLVDFKVGSDKMQTWCKTTAVSDTTCDLVISIPGSTKPGLYYATVTAQNLNTKEKAQYIFSFAVSASGTVPASQQVTTLLYSFKEMLIPGTVNYYWRNGTSTDQEVTLIGKNNYTVHTTISQAPKSTSNYKSKFDGDWDCSGFAKMISSLLNGSGSYRSRRLGDNRRGGNVPSYGSATSTGSFSRTKLTDVDIEIIEDLRPGDALRVKSSSSQSAHSLVVISVDGDTYHVFECNHPDPYKAVISWDKENRTKLTLARGGASGYNQLFTVNRYQFYADRNAHEGCIDHSIEQHNNQSLRNGSNGYE